MEKSGNSPDETAAAIALGSLHNDDLKLPSQNIAEEPDEATPKDGKTVEHIVVPEKENTFLEEISETAGTSMPGQSNVSAEITELVKATLAPMYCFRGSTEFYRKPTDTNRNKLRQVLAQYRKSADIGYAEIPLIHAHNWFHDLRFAKSVEDPEEGKNFWHFGLVIINPKAPKLHHANNALQLSYLSNFTILARKFYISGFAPSETAVKSISIALKSETTIMVVAKRLTMKTKDTIVDFHKMNHLTVVAAITFRHVAAPDNPFDVAASASWLHVASNSTTHPTSIPGWRRQGFGLFMIICLIKNVYSVEKGHHQVEAATTKGNSPKDIELNIYLQCVEISAFHFYGMIGFKLLNGKNDDGFELLPMHLQKSIQFTSNTYMPGESVFHYYGRSTEHITSESVPFKLLVLKHKQLMHFKDAEVPVIDVEGDGSANTDAATSLRNFWCQYPPPKIRRTRLEYSKKQMQDVFMQLPLLNAFFKGEFADPLPATALALKGSISIERRLQHTQEKGTKWMSSDEIDLMIATILFDGRYQDSCFVLPCGFALDIQHAFQKFVDYEKAKKLHYSMKKKNEDDANIDATIRAQFKQKNFQMIASEYAAAMNHILKYIICRYPGLLFHKIIVFPNCDAGLHWSAVFVFNAANIDQPIDEMEASSFLRPSFFRYCSMYPHGERFVGVDSGIQYFLNLCFSHQVHEKRYSNPLSANMEMVEPFGHERTGHMLGTPEFSALHLNKASNAFPRQVDFHNCGIGLCATIAILLRDVLQNEESFDDLFSYKSMRLQTCSVTQEYFCDFPQAILTPLPAKEELPWGDYLTALREEWFVVFDRMALLQHETVVKSVFHDHEILPAFSANKELIQQWPMETTPASLTNVATRRTSPRKPKGKSNKKKSVEPDHVVPPKPSIDKPIPRKPKATTATPEVKIESDHRDVKGETSMSFKKKGKVEEKENLALEGMQDAPPAKRPSKAEEREAERKQHLAERNEFGSLTGKGDDIRNFDPKFKKPVPFEAVAIKLPPLKRKFDQVERVAMDLYLKIKKKDPKDAALFEPVEPLETTMEPKVCSQSLQEVNDFHNLYPGQSYFESVEIDEEKYKEDLEAFIDKSFIDWEWHSEKKHRNWLSKEAAKMDHPNTSAKARKAIQQLIAVVKEERRKFRKHFANEFRFSQQMLVKGLKYVKQNNSFVARMVWKERVSQASANTLDSNENKYVEKEDEMRVDEDWIVQQYGKRVLQHVINMRQTDHWTEVPRDVEITIGKHKVVRLRYVPPKTRMIVDMEKLTQMSNDSDADQKPSARSPKKRKTELLQLTPTKLRPFTTKRKVISGTPPKVARESLVKIVDVGSDDEDQDMKKPKMELPRTAVTISEKWIGKTTDGKETTLQEDFVFASFGEAFMNEVKTAKRGFIDIPVGDFKPSHLHLYPELKVIGAPIVKFVHSNGKDLCVSKSLASAFYSIGWHDVATQIDDFGEKTLGGLVVDVMERVNLCAKKILPSWVKSRLMPLSFAWNLDLTPRDVFVGVLYSSDGSCSHAVAIHGGFVYDANECVALPLCQAALDYCTSTEKVKSTFVRFKKGFLYRYEGTKQEKLRRMTLKAL